MDTLLINKIDPQEAEVEREIFFQIGEMDKNLKALLDAFNACDCVYYGRGKLRYNGLSLRLTTAEIPEVVKVLVEMGLKIYGVYALYT